LQSLVSFLRGLGASRLMAMVAVTAALIGFFAFVIMRVTTPQMTTLFTDLSLEDSSAVIKDLERQAIPFEIRNVEEVNQAFVDMERARADGLIVFGGPVTLEHRSAIVGLAALKQLPAVWSDRERVIDGGLMSYGADVADLYRRAAGYVDRIAAPLATWTAS